MLAAESTAAMAMRASSQIYLQKHEKTSGQPCKGSFMKLKLLLIPRYVFVFNILTARPQYKSMIQI